MASKLPRKELPMTDYCAFNKNHKCIKWSDYELTRHELIEIQHLRNYIDLLQELLTSHGIEILPEY